MNRTANRVQHCHMHSEKYNKKFCEELIAYFPWYYTGHIENDASNNSSTFACIFATAATFLPSRFLATIGGFLLNRCLATTRGYLPSRCLATIRGLLLSRCVATIGGGYADTHINVIYCCMWICYRGKVSTKPLPSNDRKIFSEPIRCLATIKGYTDTQTNERDLWSTPLRWARVAWYTYQVS
jgi:hypothetical protein